MVAAHKRLLKRLPAPEDFHQNHKSARNAQQATVKKMARPVCEQPPGKSAENDDKSTYLLIIQIDEAWSGRKLAVRENRMEEHGPFGEAFDLGGY